MTDGAGTRKGPASRPSSRFVPDDQPTFEAFRGLPFAHGDAYFELDAEFPVVDRDQPL